MNSEDEALLQSARELDLVTTGRTSGLARSVELWHAYKEGYVYLLCIQNASGTPMHWYRNLKVNPEASLRVKGQTVYVRNEPVDDLEATVSHIWELMLSKYGADIMRRYYEGSEHLPVKLKVAA